MSKFNFSLYHEIESEKNMLVKSLQEAEGLGLYNPF